MTRWLLGAFLFLFGSVAAFVCLWIVWSIVVVSTGGAVFECDRGDCGRVGNWTYDHGGLLTAIFAALGVLIAGAALGRPSRSAVGGAPTDMSGV